MFKGFKQFLLRGNVLDLAIGVVVGAAFSGVVNALVKDILSPLIAVIIRAPDFSGLVFSVRGSRFMYGDFINAIISFLLIATAIYFFVVAPMNALIAKARARKGEPVDPTTKKCPECLSAIPIDAKRCAYCAQPLP